MMCERQGNPNSGHDVILAQQPDRIREQFEADWQAALTGAPWPRLETYLATASPTEQPRLQQELQAIDSDYRQRLADANPGHASTLTSQCYYHPVDAPPSSLPSAGMDQPPSSPTPSRADNLTEVLAAKAQTVPEEKSSPPTPQATVDWPGQAAAGEPTLAADPKVLAGAATGDFSLDETTPSTSATDGPTVAGYEILGELGRGGMGVVYKARQKGLNRLVALKMVLAGSHAGAHQLARFHTEAEAVARLQHPNIVQIYEVGDQAGLPYFSLEFVDGGSLADKLQRRPLPPRQAARLAELLAGAMHYAHEHDIIHRDLKPSNILLTQDGVPKITDFGLAKRLEGDSSQTRSGTLMGTPSYMAPEQARGEVHEIGPLADVYALGAILYELLTGRPPFVGATMLDTLEQVRLQEPVPPSGLQPTVPRDLETICLKCLQKEPLKRYASAGALAQDLRRFLAGEPILARPVGALERFWRWCRRNPRVAALSAAVLVLLVAVTAGSIVAAVQINQEKELALAASALARNAQQKAETAHEQAEAAHQKAEQNAKIAGEQRRLALEALNTLVTKVQTQLADKPGTQKLKQELLETALAGLRKVAQSAERSPLADLSMAEAHRRMGRIFEQLGRTKEARQQYEHLHAITQAEAASDPTSAQAKRNLALSYDMVGNVCRLLGEKAAARDYYSQALQLRQELAGADPGNPTSKADLAASYFRLGTVSGAEAAQQHYTEALQLRQELAAAAPGNLAAQRAVWIAHNELGDLSLRRDDPSTARTHYRAALELMQKLVQAAPQSPQLKHSLATSYEKLGTLSRRLGQAALPVLGASTAGLLGSPFGHGSFLAGSALIPGRTGQADEAQKSYAQALDLLQPLAANDPQDLPVQGSLMLVLAYAAQHRAAAERAEHLRGLVPENSGTLYNVACCYALCAAAVAHGKANQPLPAEEQALAQRYAEQALEALRQAVTHGFKDLDLLQTDPDLDYIRQHAAYAALLQQFKGADDRD